MSTAIKEDQIVEFRFLEGDEHYKLSEVYREYESTPPPSSLARIAVAELEGEIVGFLANCLTPQVTMWIKEEYRNGGLWVKLVEMVLPLAERTAEIGVKTYVICDTIETEAICEKMGLRRIDKPVYVKD